MIDANEFIYSLGMALQYSGSILLDNPHMERG